MHVCRRLIYSSDNDILTSTLNGKDIKSVWPTRVRAAGVVSVDGNNLICWTKSGKC